MSRSPSCAKSTERTHPARLFRLPDAPNLRRDHPDADDDGLEWVPVA